MNDVSSASNATVNFDHALDSLEGWSSGQGDSFEVLKSLVADLNPDVAQKVADAELGHFGDIITEDGSGRDTDMSLRLENRLKHLQWYDGSETQLLVSVRQGRDRQQPHAIFQNDYDFAWLDIEITGDEDVTHVPHAALTGVREECVKHYTERISDLQDLREKLVLFVTIHGPQYPMPDIALVGPSKREDTEEAEPDLVKTIYLPLRNHVHAGDRRGSIRNELQDLAGLAAGNTNWKATFKHAYQSVAGLRRSFRNRMKEALSNLMGLLEETTGREAADDELEVLREAATLIAYRLMFLMELERRGLLYNEAHSAGSLVELTNRNDEHALPEPGTLVSQFQHLTRAFSGDIDDPAVALEGASIFRDKPTPRFDDRLERWLAPLDEFDASVDQLHQNFDADLLRRWDETLSETAAIVTGQITDYVQMVGGGATGFGGEEHSHRVLGDVYEQILAMVPGRDDDGQVELQLASHHSDDERSALGAHYTPPELVEEVVRPALGHLFRQIWDEVDGNPDEYVARLWDLKYLDPAMGSAHFLTVTALEIAREIAYVQVMGSPRDFDRHEPLDYPEPLPVEELDDNELEAIRLAAQESLPRVVKNCAHGVDINPLAAELGKLALWLFTLAVRENTDTPYTAPELTFLDENIKVGDSLIGVTLREALDIVQGALRSDAQDAAMNLSLFESPKKTLEERVEGVTELQRLARAEEDELAAWADEHWTDTFPDTPVPDSPYRRSEKVAELANERLEDIRWLYDLAVLVDYHGYSSGTRGSTAKDFYESLTGESIAADDAKDSVEELLTDLTEAVGHNEEEPDQRLQNVIANIRAEASDLDIFHWQLEYTDILDVDGQGENQDGFDLIVANPPFIGDRGLRSRITPEGKVDYLAKFFIEPVIGRANKCDYAGFFWHRYLHLIATSGAVGTLGPKTIAQAANREYVLKPIFLSDDPRHPRMFRALRNDVWPGEADVNYCLLHFTKSQYLPGSPGLVVDGELQHTNYISTFLDPYPDYELSELASSEGLVYQGLVLRGDFSMPKDEYGSVPQGERDAIVAYLNSRDVQQQPRPIAQKVAIDFEAVLRKHKKKGLSEKEKVSWLSEKYPYLSHALDEQNAEKDPNFPFFHRYRDELRAAWEGLESVIAFGATTTHWIPRLIPKKDPDLEIEICPTHALYISPTDSYAVLGVISSILFEIHLRRLSSTLRQWLRVSPTSVFPTFPFPWLPQWSKGMERPAALPAPGSRGSTSRIENAAREIVEHRRDVLESPIRHEVSDVSTQWGPTKLYNLYDDEDCELESIEKLRQLHVDLLDAVLRAYGWDDLADDCSREDWVFDRPWIDRTPRFVPNYEARGEMIRRLAELNRERYDYELGLYKPRVLEHLDPNAWTSEKKVFEACTDAGIDFDRDLLAEILKRADEAGDAEHKWHGSSYRSWRRS